MDAKMQSETTVQRWQRGYNLRGQGPSCWWQVA